MHNLFHGNEMLTIWYRNVCNIKLQVVKNAQFIPNNDNATVVLHLVNNIVHNVVQAR